MHRIARKLKPAKAKPRLAHLGTRWQLQEAKAQLSRLVKEAQKEPQIITLHGEEIVVVQSMKDYKKSRRTKSVNGLNIFEALLKCPPGPPLVIDRNPNDVVGAGTRNIFE